jgi:hypothetical protein
MVANHPHALGLLKARADLTGLIIAWFPGLEEWRGFVQDPGKEKPQCSEDHTPPKCGKTSPANQGQQPTTGYGETRLGRVCRLHVLYLHGSGIPRVLASMTSQAHGRASWHGMACACAHPLHLLGDRGPALLLVSCTHRCSGQGYPAPFG